MNYVISDTHFGHTNIIGYTNRPFDSVEEMNEALIQKWNNVVNKDDKVYHLGDFSFHGSQEQIKTLVSRLNGFIILVKGNHDVKSTKWYYEAGFFEVYSHSIVYTYIDGVPVILSHRPVDMDINFYNIHGHIHDRVCEYPNHFNVSVEVQNYQPINLEEFIEQLRGE